MILQHLGMLGVAVAVQGADVFAERVDLGTLLVALRDDGAEAVIRHHGALELGLEVGVTSAREPREDAIEVGADAQNVEHRGTLLGRRTRLDGQSGDRYCRPSWL